ncbi:MAG: hypothetical protein RI907_2037 [Pseudomonadota bacterium]|jgi:hemerythrin-like domain-containing protein
MLPQPVQPRIDDPMALLNACHDKVRHFSKLAQRLRDHVAAHGCDRQAREAATAVLRYFNLAAPLHHQDEDLDLYPALLALGDDALTQQVERLSAQHGPLHEQWVALRPWLEALASGATPVAPAPDVDAFAQGYRAHAQAEEQLLYPHASRLSATQLCALADTMSQRRRQPPG